MSLVLRTGGGGSCYRRYVVTVQYHGGSFLGFSYQGINGENCITPNDKTDLRGWYSVEGRLRLACAALFGSGGGDRSDDWYNNNNNNNIQVSSRTDRGVHAIKNTFHIDVHSDSNLSSQQIRNGLNYHLSHQQHNTSNVYESSVVQKSRKRSRNGDFGNSTGRSRYKSPMMDELRILNVYEAPHRMPNYDEMQIIYQKLATGELTYEKIRNEYNSDTNYYNNNNNNNDSVEWNARYSAIQRTYMYRIIQTSQDNESCVRPFEWDRSWIVCNNEPLNITAMCDASKKLIGTYDFTSFRGKGCQRQSPIVTMQDIRIVSQPYNPYIMLGGQHGIQSSDNFRIRNHDVDDTTTTTNNNCNLITILYQGNAFLYRQVRNITGCLLSVGRNKKSPDDVQRILDAKDRSNAPMMAPAHGLFLLDVKHIGIDI